MAYTLRFNLSHFAVQSHPYCTMKWAILRGKMAEIDGQKNGGKDARLVRPNFILVDKLAVNRWPS